jgi:hypothetical protein
MLTWYYLKMPEITKKMLYIQQYTVIYEYYPVCSAVEPRGFGEM